MGKSAIYGTILRVRDKSILFAIQDDSDDTIWIPKSVIEESESDLDLGDEGCVGDPEDMLVATWWYEKNIERFE